MLQNWINLPICLLATIVAVAAQCPLPVNPQQNALLEEVTYAVHYNGNPDSCGAVPAGDSLVTLMEEHLQTMNVCDGSSTTLNNKYWFETFLTNVFHYQFSKQGDGTTCASEDDDSMAKAGMFGYCDMGVERTVTQPDSKEIIATEEETLPCRFFTREGIRIDSLTHWLQMLQDQKNAHMESCGKEETCAASVPFDLYAVPAGRVFMFAPKFVGEIFRLDHVRDATGQPLSMEVLSLEPRVFDIFNFVDVDESQQLIDKALRETSETHGLHRSTTGVAGASVFSKRTSENAWDTHGTLALRIKKRCLQFLGFDQYYESHTDGLQILRYNLTKAYTTHMDYLDGSDQDPYDYETAGKGGNRFATILLYMSDLAEDAGGETVFSEAPPFGETELRPVNEVVRELRQSESLGVLEPNSWEETMTAKCRSRLSVKPYKSRAVLFYSQQPNGEPDKKSMHGGCPVLDGTKWAANLWVWNAPRAEFEHAPFRPGMEKEANGQFNQIKAKFRNTGKDPRFKDAELYYDESGFFGLLGPNQQVDVNTYRTHVWNIKSKSTGEILKQIVIDSDDKDLLFEF